MEHRLLHSDWGYYLAESGAAAKESVKIMCPFIRKTAVEKLLQDVRPLNIQVLTRFNVEDFYNGVNDTEAMRFLMDNGAQIRGVMHLHSKLYLFDDWRAIVTSANLTESALNRNVELGILTEEPSLVKQCHQEFDGVWKDAGEDLTYERLAGWDTVIASERKSNAQLSQRKNLPDEGTSVRRGVSDGPAARRKVLSVGGGQAQGNLSAKQFRKQQGLRFLEALLERARTQKGLIKSFRLVNERYISIETGIPGVRYGFVARGKTKSAIELIINKGAEGVRAFERLKKNKNLIEESFGGDLEWNPIGTTRQIVKVYLGRGFASSDEEVRQLHTDMLRDMVRLQFALAPYIARKKLGL